jgi:hypothetical protein
MAEETDTTVFNAPQISTPKSLKQATTTFNTPKLPSPSVSYKQSSSSIDPGFNRPTNGVNKTPSVQPKGIVKPRTLPATPKSGRDYQNSNVLPDRGSNAARRPMINPTMKPAL